MKARQKLTRFPSMSLGELEADGIVSLGRGKVISKRDLAATPGAYPVYSSAKENEGKFGEYGEFMFNEEMITWSVDGGGRLFHRPRHRFSVTNVGGTLRVTDPDKLDCRFLYFMLSYLHSIVVFDWVQKAHPSVIRKVYDTVPLPPLEEQRRIVAVLDEAFAAIATATVNAEKNLANARLFSRLALEGLLVKHSENSDEVDISEVADIESGAGFPDRFQGRRDEAIPFFKVGDMNTPGNETVMTIANNTISDATRTQLRARLFPVGSVIFPKVGGAIATNKKRLVGVPCCVDNNVMGIIPKADRLDATLLHQLLVNKPLTEFSNDAGLPSIRKSRVAAWRIRMPKDIKAQKLLADRLTAVASAVMELTDIYDRKVRLAGELQQTFLYRAFTGELTATMPKTIAA